MYRSVIVFPVLPGKTESEIRSIADRFTADPEGYLESRRLAGTTLERAYWQHTTMGDFVVGYLESDRSAADVAATWARQATEMDRFFVATVKEVHGIDLTNVPEGRLRRPWASGWIRMSPSAAGEWPSAHPWLQARKTAAGPGPKRSTARRR